MERSHLAWYLVRIVMLVSRPEKTAKMHAFYFHSPCVCNLTREWTVRINLPTIS